MASPGQSEEQCKPSKISQHGNESLGNQGVEYDDEVVHGMTASYTEISFNTQSSEPDDSVLEDLNESLETNATNYLETTGDSKDRPNNLPLSEDVQASVKSNSANKAAEFLNHLNGTITQEGAMVSFVAEDLETKIKLSSPVSCDTNPWNNGMPWIYRHALTGTIPSAIDPEILANLEAEVGKIATSVDSLTENLAGILHSMSALTVDCLETYRDVVCKTCDAVDQNIKSMYQLMAKCEELSKSMQPIYKLAEHVKEIKHFLEIFENTMN